MKWVRAFGFLLFGLFLCVAALTIFLETALGARVAKNMLLRSLKQKGIKVEIESIQGQIPEEVDLQGVKISFPDLQIVWIEKLHVELSLLRLLKREIAIRSLIVSGIRVDASTSLKPEFELNLPVRLNIHSFRMERMEFLPNVTLNGKLNLKKKGALELSATTDQYGPLTIDLFAKGTWNRWSGHFKGHFLPDSSLATNHWVQGLWNVEGQVEKTEGGIYQLQNVLANGKHLHLQGAAEFDQRGQWIGGHFQTTVPQTQFFATTEFQNTVQGIQLQGQWRLPSFSMEGKWDGKILNQMFSGQTTALGIWLKERWAAQSRLTYRFGQALELNEITLDSPLGTGTGSLVLRSDRLWVGKVQFTSFHLDALQIPHLTGLASGQATFEGVDHQGRLVQAARLQTQSKELIWDKFYAKEASLEVSLQENRPSHFHGSCKDAQWKELLIGTAEFDFGETGPFELSLNGTLRDPLTLQLKGELEAQKLRLSKMSGTLLGHQFALTSLTSFQWEDKDWNLQPTTLSFGKGTLLAEGNPKDGLTLHLSQMPLDLLSLNSLHVNIQGTVSGNAFFSQINGTTSADWKTSIRQLQIGDRERRAEGTFVGSLHQGQLKTEVAFQSGETPLLSLEASLPFHLELSPLKMSFPLNKPVEGRLFMDGHVEDILDFFNLGAHRFTGHWTCNLQIRNTLGFPKLEGKCEIQDGTYENYLTGTTLNQLQTTILASKDELLIQRLTAQDELTKGTLNGVGSVRLTPSEKFPFHFNFDFNRLNLAQIDLVKATAEGHVSIRGNQDKAEATGKVEILEANFSIPEQLPTSLPSLQVVYKHAEKKPTFQEHPSPYPLHLHLSVSAPKQVFIHGRGLSSEWKGDFHIGGTYTSPAAKGSLELIGGEFVFSSRRFILTEGAFSFSGKEYEMPTIDLAGHMAERGISITARLKGPLNQPELTFQSSPPLPFGSILSYLLFGKDISEIDGFQAIQLASSISSLSGQSPDVLENIRKSLGIDRLRIISSSSGEEGSDTVSIQVGKYIAKGVLVSFSQGADDSSSNISVEVDLKHGFVFQIETEQQEEQGKFTLKWNVNY